MKIKLIPFLSIFNICFGADFSSRQTFDKLHSQIYNPLKVTKETFGAVKKRGSWRLPIGHPMLRLMKEGYMIHPSKPNAMIPNPHTKAGRKLIASMKPKYAPSRGFKANKPKESSSDEMGIASDFLRDQRAKQGTR